MLNSRKRLSEQLRPDPSKQTLNDSLAVSYSVLGKPTVFSHVPVSQSEVLIATAPQNFVGPESTA